MPAVKNRKKGFDAAFKLKAIEYAKEHGNRAAGREFSIDESLV
jgi:predicted GNAT family acetyltransferase